MAERPRFVTACVIGVILRTGVLTAQAGPVAPPRLAVWGSVTEYAEAVAIDSPFRESRNRFWDGRSGERPLSEQSKPRGLAYNRTRGHESVLEELRGSTAVAVAEVDSVKSYLSHDETTIYSEMTVILDRVMWDRSGLALATGSHITAVRAGGAIRVAPGRLLIRGCLQESMPRRHGRYLLVLGYSGAANSMFPVLGAYELSGDHVYMLDSVEPTTSPARRPNGPAHQSFVLEEYGLPSVDFLEVVEETLRARTGAR